MSRRWMPTVICIRACISIYFICIKEIRSTIHDDTGFIPRVHKVEHSSSHIRSTYRVDNRVGFSRRPVFNDNMVPCKLWQTLCFALGEETKA